MSAEQELKVVAYRVDWPAEIGIAPDRFYGADDAHRMNCHLSYVHGVAAPIVVPLVRLTDAQSALESERQAHAAEVERLRWDAEWISVADRMPPPITTVIAHGRQYGDHGRHPKVYTTYTGTRVRETVEDEEITHWMPLPQAPVSAIDQAIARGKT